MIPAARFLQRASLFQLRANLSTTTSGESSISKEEEYYLDMGKFVDTIGIDARTSNKGKTFARMLRESKLMQLGSIRGRVVTGIITHRMQDDLYIDFGLKFNAVCRAPAENSEDYRVGSTVLLQLHDAELSEKFLGSNKDLTLLEADATLIGLRRPRPRATPEQSKPSENAQKAPEA